MLFFLHFYFCLFCIFIARNALQGKRRTDSPLTSGWVELGVRAFAAMYLAHIIGYVGIFWAGPIAWMGGAVVVCGGYFFIVMRLSKEDMRQIFIKKHMLKYHNDPLS